jgi:hypothetical protein
MRNLWMLLAVGGVAAFVLTRRTPTASATVESQPQLPRFTGARLILPPALYIEPDY